MESTAGAAYAHPRELLSTLGGVRAKHFMVRFACLTGAAARHSRVRFVTCLAQPRPPWPGHSSLHLTQRHADTWLVREARLPFVCPEFGSRVGHAASATH